MSDPILKWAGGKRALADQIAARLPARFGRYVEPFVGGGAVFFRLDGGTPTRSALLSDANPALIATYQTVAAAAKRVHRELVALVETWCAPDEVRAASYYELRREFNDIGASVNVLLLGDSCDTRVRYAALMLYLNRACFNGLWRVGRRGRFNVPIGRYATLSIPSAADLETAAAALRRADVRHADFRVTLADCGYGDAVYCDPPYPGTFDGYAAGGFRESDQLDLMDAIAGAVDRGAYVVLSISDHLTSRLLYSPELHRGRRRVTVGTVAARRSVGSRGNRRGSVDELLITMTKESPCRDASTTSSSPPFC